MALWHGVFSYGGVGHLGGGVGLRPGGSFPPGPPGSVGHKVPPGAPPQTPSPTRPPDSWAA
ncbi:hypothetical protein GCM10010508_32560 [Streptomyces naganishii JCM 4654]|uniref:Uncharacterized protein n=1 Tax=Streptomyces naganishii JCM 4654 TaxID=1306179 RepID=A0A919CVJ3_9ACTN|nr:hypothetical protein GCM10010508_32560 [Streptomyces naganishii JCM 4654]